MDVKLPRSRKWPEMAGNGRNIENFTHPTVIPQKEVAGDREKPKTSVPSAISALIPHRPKRRGRPEKLCAPCDYYRPSRNT